MGIPGLTAYINSNPMFMENHKLHGCDLVIDGPALETSLFLSAGCNNSSFAGDLDKFSQRVSTFIDELLMCDVRPVVMLDGHEGAKIDTLAAKKFSQMEVIARQTPASEAGTKVSSIALSVVFEAVLRQKGVKVVRCLFDKNDIIAALATLLVCPVLSNDSDFYIFDVRYIPIDSLQPIVRKGSWRTKYVIPCRRFEQTYIYKSFPEFFLYMLPLIAVLLGNDYITPDTLETFVSGMRQCSPSERLCSTKQRKIETVFQWLEDRCNLGYVVSEILRTIPNNRRQGLLHKIETEVNRYRVLPFNMVELFALNEFKMSETAMLDQQEEFHLSSERLAMLELPCSEEESASRPVPETDSGELFYADEATEFWNEGRLAASEDSCSRGEKQGAKPVLEPDCTAEVEVTWPMCFTKHYLRGADLPAYFVDLRSYGNFDVPVQMENFDYPSAHSMTMKIVGVIHGLLVADCPDECARGLTYTIREGSHLVVRHMDTVKGTRTTNFPALGDLWETPMLMRKQIFDDTLEISGLEAHIDNVPVEWRLYVIAIVYWMRQPDEPPRNSCHMHAVLFAMLSGVVDREIGFYRSMKLFHDHYGKTLMKLKSKRHTEKERESFSHFNSVEALKFVRRDDCLLAAPIFIELCTIDKELCENPRNFNVTIVHVFAQFLSCIKEVLHLNAFLGYQYKPLNIGDFFNGTMLYNLFTRFEKVSDVEAYNREILKESPSIRHVLELLTATVKEMIEAASVGDRGSTESRKQPEDEPGGRFTGRS